MPVRTAVFVGGHEITERFVRSMGPDGRNTRRKATAVELRFDVGRSSLPADARARLIALGARLLQLLREATDSEL